MSLKKRLKNPYIVLTIIFIYFILFAFIVDSPSTILRGLGLIINSQDRLITDYVEIAGIGATLVNAGILSLISIAYLSFRKIKPDGSTIMSLLLLSGFSFFGKNLLNVWPVIAGGFLYSKFRGEHFSKYAVVSMLATSLSPTVSQIAFDEFLPLPLGLFYGTLVGILIGFVVSPIAENAMHSHHGYNLYHIGFVAGVISIIMRIILQSFGMDVSPVFIWNTESTFVLAIFLSIICVFLIAIGLYSGINNKQDLKAMLSRTGRLASDFYGDYGETCYINMGILGILGMLIAILVGNNINGPILAGIITMVGFGAFGKHIRNTVPVIIGLLLGNAFLSVSTDNPAAIITILFGTCLAPIAGTFGWKWGIVAGFLHILIATNITEISGGMNLYSNGLAGGLAVMFLVPLIQAVKYPYDTVS